MAALNGHTETIRALLEAGANIEVRDIVSELHYIWLLKGHIEAVRLLVQYGAQINQVDDQQRTARDVADDQAIIDYFDSIPQLTIDLWML